MPDSVWWLLGLLVVSAAGWWWEARRERRRPSSYSHQPDALTAWRSLPNEVQAAHENAVLDAAEAAENAARSQSVPRP
jgi:hypothetical protein